MRAHRPALCCLIKITVVAFLREALSQQVGVDHTLCVVFSPTHVLDLHVLVLNVGVKSLQLTQLQEVGGEQSERLQDPEGTHALLVHDFYTLHSTKSKERLEF